LAPPGTNEEDGRGSVADNQPTKSKLHGFVSANTTMIDDYPKDPDTMLSDFGKTGVFAWTLMPDDNTQWYRKR